MSGMATGRREQEALRLGEDVVRYIQSGEFRKKSPQAMGNDIRRLLALLSTRNVSFGTPERTWTVVHEMVRESLLDLAENIRIYHIQGRGPGVSVVAAPKEEYPLNAAIVLFGTNDPRFTDIGVTDVNRGAARMIGTFAPSFVDVIPEEWRMEALPPVARPPKVGAPTVHVTVPTAEIREEISKLGEELGVRVESGLVAGFDKLTATLPILIRGMGVAAAPFPPPSPPVQVPQPVAAGVPLTEAEIPRTGIQRTIFGERVAPPPRPGAAPSGLAQQLEDRYRPLFLRDVVGNSSNVAILRGAATSGNWGKLYLFTGRPGVGKTSAALASVRDYLLDRQGAFGTALFNPIYSPLSPTFGISPQVLLYANALDLLRRGGTSALIGDVAKFTRTLGLPGLKRFVILDDVTRFDKNQQQVLLPLTERYPNTVFMFLANDAQYIDALESRARHLRWSSPEPEEVELRLITIIQNENLPFPDAVQEAREIVSSLGLVRDFRQAIVRLAADVAELQGTRA